MFNMMSIPTVKIVMTGPTGVGKTSLLAAMYPHWEKPSFQFGDYELFPAPDKESPDTSPTRTKLAEALNKIKEFSANPTNTHSGTPEPDEFDYLLLYENDNGQKTTELLFQIWDIPGGFCTDTEKDNNGNPTGTVKAQKFLNGADVSFWCIDCIALMEPKSHNGQWLGEKNDNINKPDIMVKCLAESNISEGHTVIIVLMRAESYAQGGGYAELYQQLKSRIAQYVLELRKNRKIDKVYYCAVETTGCIIYNGTERERYIVRSGEQYNPKHCEVPVLCAIQHSLEKTVNQIQWKAYRFAWWCPFIRFLLPFYWRLNGTSKRLEKRLRKVRAEIGEKLEHNLFEW
jgi:GTPase SAR1 family protein